MPHPGKELAEKTWNTLEMVFVLPLATIERNFLCIRSGSRSKPRIPNEKLRIESQEEIVVYSLNFFFKAMGINIQLCSMNSSRDLLCDMVPVVNEALCTQNLLRGWIFT